MYLLGTSIIATAVFASTWLALPGPAIAWIEASNPFEPESAYATIATFYNGTYVAWERAADAGFCNVIWQYIGTTNGLYDWVFVYGGSYWDRIWEIDFGFSYCGLWASPLAHNGYPLLIYGDMGTGDGGMDLLISSDPDTYLHGTEGEIFVTRSNGAAPHMIGGFGNDYFCGLGNSTEELYNGRGGMDYVYDSNSLFPRHRR